MYRLNPFITFEHNIFFFFFFTSLVSKKLTCGGIIHNLGKDRHLLWN